MNPFAKEAMKVFKREKFEPCSTKRPLTTVSQNFENDTVQLTIHNDRKKEYLAWWQSDVKVSAQLGFISIKIATKCSLTVLLRADNARGLQWHCRQWSRLLGLQAVPLELVPWPWRRIRAGVVFWLQKDSQLAARQSHLSERPRSRAIKAGRQTEAAGTAVER